MHDGQRFGPWRPPSALSTAPEGDAVVQIKLDGTLLDYPTGKSAMLWYGRAAGSLSRAAGAALQAATERFDADSLRWRALFTPDAEARLDDHLARFTRRFGAPPRLNSAQDLDCAE